MIIILAEQESIGVLSTFCLPLTHLNRPCQVLIAFVGSVLVVKVCTGLIGSVLAMSSFKWLCPPYTYWLTGFVLIPRLVGSASCFRAGFLY